MSYALTSGDLNYQPSRAEAVLRALLSFVLGVPVLIFRVIVMILVIRLINFLLGRIVAAHLAVDLHSENRDIIERNAKGVAEFVPKLRAYQKTLHNANLPWFIFSERQIRKLDCRVDDFEDLEMAHQIFLEPVKRDYPLSVEFQTLRRGRKVLANSYPPEEFEVEEELESKGQIVLPSQMNN